LIYIGLSQVKKFVTRWSDQVTTKNENKRTFQQYQECFNVIN